MGLNLQALPAPGPAGALLRVEGLKKHYPIRTGFRVTALLRAVDGVSFEIGRGETLGLVGESGSGKSTIGRCVLRLEDPTAGEVWYQGQPLARTSAAALRPYRREMQMVFQDPYDSLNPRLTVGEMVAEPLVVNRLCSPKEARQRVKELFHRVGLKQELIGRYPHQLSGGQNQRVGIARALATEPRLLVLDEPTSALDVSVQAKLVNLLARLQQEMRLSYLFISHDLAVVSHLSARVVVLYLGRVVEVGTRDQIYGTPRHPYTMALMSALSGENPLSRRQGRIALSGEIPSPINPPAGCRLASRCPFAAPECATIPQILTEVADGHQVACHRAVAGEIA